MPHARGGQRGQKIWFGQTVNGTYPDPQIDNGTSRRLSRGHLWYGLPRNTSLDILAGPTALSIAPNLVALELQDPTYAEPSFRNATGNGQNRWRQLDYAGLAHAYFEAWRSRTSSATSTLTTPISGVSAIGVGSSSATTA